MTFLVQFTGHIRRLYQPTDFPDAVYINTVVHGETRDAINISINRYAGTFIAQQAMIAFRNPAGIAKDSIDLEERLIVPLSMISYIETNVFPVSGNIPVVGEDGKWVTVDQEGKETEVKPS